MASLTRRRSKYITLILVSVVESSHELVAPETLEPIIKTLLKEFITDYRPGPLIQLGINTLREMAMRCPLCLDAETLKQVTQFKACVVVSSCAFSLLTSATGLHKGQGRSDGGARAD